MIKILAEGSAAKASKRRAQVSDSSSDDEPPKKSKKAVGTAPAPQTLGDAETDSDGEIRDDTLSVAGSDDDLLNDLDKDLDEGKKMGDAVADSLANIVNKSFRRKLSEDKLKERFDKYLRPSNCAALQVPLVNKEIWKTMSADARKADIKASHVQKAVAKAGVALADSTQALLRAQRAAGKETKEQIQTAVQKNGDALVFLGHASHDLSLRRRHAIRPFLHQSLAGLCTDTQPVTQFLFGDNLAASMKDIKEMEKIGSAVASTSGTQYPAPKYHSRYGFQSGRNRPFLGQRAGHWTRQRGRGNQRPFAFGGKTRPYTQHKKQ